MSFCLPDYFWVSEINCSAKVVNANVDVKSGKCCSAAEQIGCIKLDQITCFQNLRDIPEIKFKGVFFILILCGEGERCEEFGVCYRDGREQGLNQHRFHMFRVLSESGSMGNYACAVVVLVMSGYKVAQYRIGRYWAKIACCPECPPQDW